MIVCTEKVGMGVNGAAAESSRVKEADCGMF